MKASYDTYRSSTQKRVVYRKLMIHFSSYKSLTDQKLNMESKCVFLIFYFFHFFDPSTSFNGTFGANFHF